MRRAGIDRLTSTERAALERTLGEAYIEIFPTRTILERTRALPPGSFVAVTCSPSQGVEATLDLCEELVTAGYRVVPHVAARMVCDDTHLDSILRRIDALRIDCLFVPGGDAPEPLGRFATALDLLRAIAGRPHEFREIGVAAHPEGHPAVDRERMLAELEKKQLYATYFVTQMCFDAGALGDWLGEVRRRGVTLPAWIGLPGVGERASLLATSLRIGVGDSLRFLRRQSELVGRILQSSRYEPDELLFELAPWIADPALGVAGFHVFCFNQVAATEAWRHELVGTLRNGAARAETSA